MSGGIEVSFVGKDDATTDRVTLHAWGVDNSLLPLCVEAGAGLTGGYVLVTELDKVTCKLCEELIHA